MEKPRCEYQKGPSQMYPTTGVPAPATSAFLDQFKAYVLRWLRRQQSECASAPAEPAGPGRPRELPAKVLWSTLLLGVLQRVRGVREVWRALVCQGYDLCDQAVYARLERDGTEPLQALFAQLSRMLAAWVQVVGADAARRGAGAICADGAGAG